ncbi:hypothetical protein HDU91_000598 [Kappamyces sp. JEL0680]|nr:hypothetical protein HDU91_000598 [Kappamyces sp. JEL0680]
MQHEMLRYQEALDQFLDSFDEYITSTHWTAARKDQVQALVRSRFDAFKSHSLHAEKLGLAMKQKLMSLVQHEGIMVSFQLVFNVLDFGLAASQQEHFDTNTVLLAIEDLMDVLTTQDAVKLFDYLESRSLDLTMNLEPNKGKALTLLRLCNELLRRLSKAKNTQTCGRVLIFLSSVFPLSDRSGLNQKGEFNVENTTEFETADTEFESEENEQNLAALYNSFWELQRFFSNPVPVLLHLGQFRAAQSRVDAVLDLFEKIGKQILSGKRSNGSEQKPIISANSKLQYQFFAKYLTSPNLFRLEVEDPSFRRQWLFQLLIITQFISYCIGADPSEITNKSVLFRFKLAREDEDWVVRSKKRATEALELISPGGRTFTKLAQTVVALDRNWVRWKAESCKSFQRNPFQGERREGKRRIEGSLASDRSFLGNDELSLLWEKGSDVRAALLHKKSRMDAILPRLETVVGDMDQQVAEDLVTPVDGIEEEYLLYNQMRFNWLAFRVAVRSDLSLFAMAEIDNKRPGKTLLEGWRQKRRKTMSETESALMEPH